MVSWLPYKKLVLIATKKTTIRKPGIQENNKTTKQQNNLMSMDCTRFIIMLAFNCSIF